MAIIFNLTDKSANVTLSNGNLTASVSVSVSISVCETG